MSGAQALSVLSSNKGCTYERPYLQHRRLCLIAHEVKDAIGQLVVDNGIGSKWHEGAAYKTLDYNRRLAILIPAVKQLSQQVKDLQSKVNGATQRCRD